jgi:hypothetical protein
MSLRETITMVVQPRPERVSDRVSFYGVRTLYSKLTYDTAILKRFVLSFLEN